jgi:Holliday junction resolvase RusA-like endonuclease
LRKVISFTVLGSPVAQPRQKHRAIHTAAGGVTTMNYTEAKHPVQQFKADIKTAAVAAGLPPAPLAGPVILECRFYLARPARLMRKRDPEGHVLHTSKPDLDNLYKSVQDALKGVLWKDDSQIVGYGPDHGKAYHEKNGRPRLELTLYSLETRE